MHDGRGEFPLLWKTGVGKEVSTEGAEISIVFCIVPFLYL
jgi:hypothetical protein